MMPDRENRRLRYAFHEAGHALVRWCHRERVGDIAIADEGQRGFILGGQGYPGCSGVVVSSQVYRAGDLFVRLHDQQTRGVQYPACADVCAERVGEELQKMRAEMACSFAGVLAEWLFFDMPLDELKTGGGRRDMRDIADLAEEYAVSEPDYAVVLKMRHDAEADALALLLEHRELLARLALVVYEKGHLPGATFESLMQKWTCPALEKITPIAV
ncbi:TPA: hypothetical protein ACOEHG_005215 [Enterobacter ludwigii]